MWPPYEAREAVLRDLERAMAATPDALDARFYYASLLRDHGRFDDAIATFESILAAAPEHVETLVALGVVLARRGRRLDARELFGRAVVLAPAHCGALVNFANVLAIDEPARADSLYRAALAVDAGFVAAHRGLCSLAAAEGDAEAAARHRDAGYAAGPFARRPYLGAEMPIGVVALVSTNGGNIPLAALLDERVFLVFELYVEAYRGEPLPPCDLIVNAVADADRGATALRLADEIARNAGLPIVNAPLKVAATGRIANAARLAQIDGVIGPAAWLVGREARPPETFPLILRVPGHHMGRRMIRVDDAAAFAEALSALPGRDDLVAAQYVETRSDDGAWRKYRVMFVDGTLYPLHLAIARHWNVHYFASEMWDRADYRAEEARFLRDPAAVLGPQAWAALKNVSDELGLDYAGIDFALAGDGRIIVFEANAAMTVLRPDSDERFAYREAASEAIARTIAHMMRRRALP